ncbi:glycosyltransferase [Ensifer adhaerens]|uniref:glycosyltransferase n=1 Tax=Ensifer adhaerens TaxID=106592 RepID=UPI0011BFE664|nr:glycosyltransferase [Ensifer adhaerens]
MTEENENLSCNSTDVRRRIAHLSQQNALLRRDLAQAFEMAESEIRAREVVSNSYDALLSEVPMFARMLALGETDRNTFSRLMKKAKRATLKGDYLVAEVFSRVACQARPTSSEAWRLYACCLNRNGANQAALGAWRRALALDRYDIEALDGLRATLHVLGHKQKAQNDLKNAFVSNRIGAADVQTPEDAPLARRVLKGGGVRPFSFVSFTKLWFSKLAQFAECRGHSRRAERYYRMLASGADDLKSLLKHGDGLARAAGPQAALDTYAAAIALAPHNQTLRRRVDDAKCQTFGFSWRVTQGAALQLDGSYVSLSDDPQIFLDPDGRSLPKSWCLFVIAAEAHVKPLQPVLYAFHGRRGEKTAAFTLPTICGSGEIRCLVPLPNDVKSLRFDPIAEPGVPFRIRRLAWLNGGALLGCVFTQLDPLIGHVGEGRANLVPPVLPTLDLLELESIKDLVPEPDGCWLTTGDDPQFNLAASGGLPSSWTLFEISIDSLNGPLEPVLYVWSANGIDPITFPRIERPGRHCFLVRLPDHVSALRFDPTVDVGRRFRLTSVSAAKANPSMEQMFVPLKGTRSQSVTVDAAVPPPPQIILRAGHNLEVTEDGAIVAVSRDVSFEVPVNGKSWPRGPLRLTVEVESSDLALEPVLEVLAESADLPVASYPLGTIEPLRRYEFDLVLPNDFVSLRLSLTLEPGARLSVPRLQFAQVPTSDPAVYTFSRFQKHSQPTSEMFTEVALVPGPHLEMAGTIFRTTGDDPQFNISMGDGAFPSGWTVISVTMNIPQGVAKPVLYFWTADRVSALPLAPLAGSMRFDQLVYLPKNIEAMRIDPLDYCGAEFSNLRVAFGPPAAMSGRLLVRYPIGDRGLDYGLWCSRYDTLSDEDHALILEGVDRLLTRPLISIVMPVYNPEPRFLRRALDTILLQLYPDWELCIAEDCSPNDEIRTILQEYAARDERIKVVYRSENGHISRASNSALELVTGSFVALMDHDDELPAHALYMVALELNIHPQADIIYTDEDKIDASGRRHDPYFKTDWNRELFYSQNIVAHLGIYRTSLVKAAGGFRVGFEGSQDYDFTLRLLKLTSTDRIRHIPHVLYHWRIFEGVRTFSSNNPQLSVETARRAMEEYFADVEPDSQVLPILSFPGWWRIKRSLPAQTPSVTVVIPTRDRVELVRACVDGLLNRTNYPKLDVLIVDNGSVEAETLSYFSSVIADPRVRILRDDGPFNYSRLNNRAAGIAQGDYICFLNNDIDVIEIDWLSEMMSQAIQPGVGAVGTRLLYGSGTLQHVGVTLGVYGVAAHGHRHFAGNSIGYFGHPQLVREVSAVTGAALLMAKTIFRTVGGFDERNLAVSYNDVDLCLRVGAAGYRIVYTPFAALFHLESASRGADVSPEQKELQRIERGYMQARWGRLLEHDPHYSPNLTLSNEDYNLAFPPRARRPWLEEADLSERLARKARAAIALPDTLALNQLAADTVMVIASQSPFKVLSLLSEQLSQDGCPRPGGIVVVDNTARRDAFVREGVLGAFRVAYPDIALHIEDDPAQDFNASRTGNLGLAVAEKLFGRGEGRTTAEHVVLILEDCSFTKSWFIALLSSWLSAGDTRTVISPRLFVKEASARVPEGYIEEPLVQRGEPLTGLQVRYDDLPLWGCLFSDDAKGLSALEPRDLLTGGILMANRSLLLSIAKVHEVHGKSRELPAVFDPLFLTPAARLEDLSDRLRAKGVRLVAALAPLAVLLAPRPRDSAHLWQYWHDYIWLNRKARGLSDNGVIEFVCPFHRGDVLIGLQVAHTAVLAGRKIRFHVAEDLLGWVKDFAPSFEVEGLPIPIPSAQETASHLLRAYEHVVRRPDGSAHLARSHPSRGLDAMNANLATAMLTAVGLPSDTPIESLEPVPSAEQIARVEELLSPYGERAVLLHRSGGWGLKTLPDAVLAHFAEIVKAEGFKLVQIGGPGDTACKEADGIIAANLSAGHWAALFRRVSAVAGVDSWSSHMAAILDVPQITFYGSTHPNHVASKSAFRKKQAPALLVPPTVACSPCNSLTCLYQPEPFCPGYSADKAAIQSFLGNLKKTKD